MTQYPIDDEGRFVYSRDWYEKEAHKELLDPDYFIDPSTSHPERDTVCLRDLELLPEHQILVCGCGGGDNIELLDKEFNCRNIQGIDFSQTAVDFCNRYFSWVTAVRGCITKMPYGDNTFDRLLAIDVTEHLPPFLYVCFLFEARRVLKPGGRMVVLPGMTKRPEHINLLPVVVIAEHLEHLGFKPLVKNYEWVIVEKTECV